jgi:hypothetical protein
MEIGGRELPMASSDQSAGSEVVNECCELHVEKREGALEWFLNEEGRLKLLQDLVHGGRSTPESPRGKLSEQVIPGDLQVAVLPVDREGHPAVVDRMRLTTS